MADSIRGFSVHCFGHGHGRPTELGKEAAWKPLQGRGCMHPEGGSAVVEGDKFAGLVRRPKQQRGEALDGDLLVLVASAVKLWDTHICL